MLYVTMAFMTWDRPYMLHGPSGTLHVSRPMFHATIAAMPYADWPMHDENVMPADS